MTNEFKAYLIAKILSNELIVPLKSYTIGIPRSVI